MSRVLTARVRKVGNSLAVIIPKELLDEAGAGEGDSVSLSLAIPTSRRDSVIESVAGLDRGKRAFKREKRDRY
jgi:antitoxin component of MazEF toxin-antitoxin module